MKDGTVQIIGGFHDGGTKAAYGARRWDGRRRRWVFGGLIADEDGVVRFEEGLVHLTRAPDYLPEDLDVS